MTIRTQALLSNGTLSSSSSSMDQLVLLCFRTAYNYNNIYDLQEGRANDEI